VVLWSLLYRNRKHANFVGGVLRPKDHHEIGARSHEVEGSSDRSFGLFIAAALAVVGALSWWHAGHLWPLYILAAVLLLALALWRPAWLAPFNRLWTRFGLLLSRIVNPLVMAALFFLVITPCAVLIRLSGRDLLRLRRDAARESCWIARDPSQPQSMKDQF
jgi:hypothetical protein